jgi:acyl-CoA reductase-like NAD-dependent aldehyde dehydrogenase
MQFFRRGKRNDLEFLSDSAEQIARSIDMTGLRTEIDQAFEAAIARARGRWQKSSEPAIDEARRRTTDESCGLSLGDVSTG